MQLDQLQRSNEPLLADVLATMLPRERQRRIVYLRRRDRVAQVVSYARASLSGVWHKTQERADAAPIEYSQEALESAERGIAFQEKVWAKMFADLRIDPLELWHEDVLAAPEAAAKSVADYLGVRLDPAARIDIPAIEKQSEGDAGLWIRKYNECRGDVAQSSSS